MIDVKLRDKLDALIQLQDEEKATCKMYDSCNSCPNLLAGGYCEIRLAISKLNTEIKKIYKKNN